MLASCSARLQDVFSNFIVHLFLYFPCGVIIIIIIIIIIVIIFTHYSFFPPVLPDGLSLEFEWQHFSISLLFSLFWLLSIKLLFVCLYPKSKSSSPFKNLLITVPKAPIKIGIIFTFIFHSCFNSLPRSRNLSFFWFSFSFGWVLLFNGISTFVGYLMLKLFSEKNRSDAI